MYRMKIKGRGFSLIELLVVIALVAIPAMIVGVLLMASTRSWNQINARVHNEIQLDSQAFTASIQSYGRKANTSNYKVYYITGGQFIEAAPSGSAQVAKGQAVELRYWQDPFDPHSTSGSALEYDNTGTNYALYYLDGYELKLDLGLVSGGVGAVSGGVRQTGGLLSTQILARNVDTAANADIFSHRVVGGRGSGCINSTLKLTDAQGDSVEIETATLLHSEWPR